MLCSKMVFPNFDLVLSRSLEKHILVLANCFDVGIILIGDLCQKFLMKMS